MIGCVLSPESLSPSVEYRTLTLDTIPPTESFSLATMNHFQPFKPCCRTTPPEYILVFLLYAIGTDSLEGENDATGARCRLYRNVQRLLIRMQKEFLRYAFDFSLYWLLNRDPETGAPADIAR